MKKTIAIALLALSLLTGCMHGDSGMKFKFVTSGQSLDQVPVYSFLFQGNSLKPLAPTQVKGSRNAAGDLLITWLRRDRTFLPLRDFAGTPLREEAEIYVIEIYSGTTLKRTIRNPKVSTAKRIVWQEVYDPNNQLTIGADQTLTFDDLGENAAARSADTFSGDFLLEFVCHANDVIPFHFGVLPISLSYNASIAGGGWDTTSALSYPHFLSQSTDNARPMGNASYQVTTQPGDRLSIHRVGSVVRFYKNRHLSGAPVPIFETNFNSIEVLQAITRFTNGVGTRYLDPSSMAFENNRAYNYTANQQVEDFGSTQSAIKIRLYQESAIVGKGAYVEVTL